MNNSLRRQVLSSFKKLHKSRKKVFDGDTAALEKARLKINEEYKSKKDVADPGAISELIELAKGVDHELRTTVVQARLVQPGKYEVKITEDTVKLDNVPYKECSKN